MGGNRNQEFSFRDIQSEILLDMQVEMSDMQLDIQIWSSGEKSRPHI